MKYYIPIILQNEDVEIQLAENVNIRKITQEEREEFFGIKNIDFGFLKNNIFINKFTNSDEPVGRYRAKGFYMHHILNDSEYIFASNFIVDCDVRNSKEIEELATDLNLAFNISKPTNTNCYVGFQANDTDVHFLDGSRDKKFIGGFLNLNDKDKIDLPVIFRQIRLLKQKEKLKFALFMNGLHSRAPIELKFLSLIMALENMFLPSENQELKLRFSLRIAKIINDKITKKDKKDVYELAVSLYDIRSKIVHCGYSKKLTGALYAQAVNLLWVSLVEYLNYPDKFKEEYLKNILI